MAAAAAWAAVEEELQARLGGGSTPLSLQVSMSEAMTAQCSPPPLEPANSAFSRLRAMGRIERSTVLESILMRQSSMKRVGQRKVWLQTGHLRLAQ